MAGHPPVIKANSTVRANEDPARYLVNPGTVRAPGKHSPGQLRHARPYLANGRRLFVFPTPVEGFTRSGQAQLGLRHYIGAWSADGVTIHYEEARITMSGTFPGLTSQQNMVECISMLRSFHKGRGLVLYAPGVFNREQYVLPENWDFTHDEEDRTHSIRYSITYVRIGEGGRVADPLGNPPRDQNRKVTPKSKPTKGKTISVKENLRTLRAIAQKVYGSAEKWPQLVAKNKTPLAQLQRKLETKEGQHKLPTLRLPIGMKIHY